MKRKIDLFWYWFIFVIAFVFCFYCVNSKSVNAYFLNDEGNIQSDNLFPISDIEGVAYLEYDIDITFEQGKTYSFCSSRTSESPYNSLISILNSDSGSDSYLYFFGRSNYSCQNFVVDTYDTYNKIRFYSAPTYNQSVGLSFSFTDNMIIESQLYNGSYIPFGVWYNEDIVGDLSKGVIGIESALLTYEDGGTRDTVNYGDVSSLIKNTFGTLYFDEVWKMLDNYAVDGYENAFIDIKFKDRFDITTKYIITTSKDNYGSGVIFYQDNVEMLSVLNLFNVKEQYCGGAPSFSCYVQLNNYVNVVQAGFNSSNAFSYLNRIKVWSDSVDMQTLTFGFENISYSQGYNSGYNVGYGVGNSNGESVGYNKGYNQGYLFGYEKGVDAVEGTDNTLVGLVGGILTAPVNMLQTIFDFEFLGINLTHFIFSIVSLFIVIWLIKIFL